MSSSIGTQKSSILTTAIFQRLFAWWRVSKLHRALGFLLVAQVFIWSITGLYMVSLDIHYIHGEDEANSRRNIQINQVSLMPLDILTQHQNATNIRLLENPLHAYYRVEKQIANSNSFSTAYLSANNGLPLPRLDISQVEILGNSYRQDSAIINIKYLDVGDDIPDELSRRRLPVWAVEFDTWDNLTLYLHSQTGDIVTTRHNAWRVFDWMWRFHIMDYDDGGDTDNWWLTFLAIAALLTSTLGSVLLWVRLAKRRKGKTFSFLANGKKRRLMKAHKYIAMTVAPQLFIWLGTGLALIWLPLTFKSPYTPQHQNVSSAIGQINVQSETVLSRTLVNFSKPVQSITLQTFAGKAVYRTVEVEPLHQYHIENGQLYDALTARPIKIGKDDVGNHVKTQLDISSETLTDKSIELMPAFTLAKYHKPLWRITLETHDIYFDPDTTSIVAMHNSQTYLKQLLLRLHFMDLFNTGKFNFWWAQVLAILLFLLALSGGAFLLQRFQGKKG